MGMVTIGKISRTRGTRGEMVVIPLTDDPNRFFTLEEVCVEKEGNKRVFKIKCVKKFKKKIFISLEGIDSPEAAKALVGAFLEIEKESLLPLPEGRYYIFEIIGLKVKTESGEILGEVKEVLSFPANDVYVVKKDKKEYNIPAIKEVIKKIDLKKKLIIIKPLEGLLE